MRTQTMEEECRDHWGGPGWNRRPRLRTKWRYNYAAMARRRKVVDALFDANVQREKLDPVEGKQKWFTRREVTNVLKDAGVVP